MTSLPRIIAFEGVDGAGKSTVIKKVAENLQQAGASVFLPRTGKEHPSHPLKMIRRLTRDPRNLELSARAELHLYCAREAQVLDQFVRAAVDRGQTVLLDRSLLTPVVMGSFGRGLDRSSCEEVAKAASCGLEADLTIVFDVHPRTSRLRKRLEKIKTRNFRDSGRKGLAGSQFKERIRNGYLQIAKDRNYPLFHVERMTPNELADRVIKRIHGGSVRSNPEDQIPTWKVDPNLGFEEALQQLPPLLRLYFVRRLVCGRQIRREMIDEEPELASWSLDHEDPLFERALEVAPDFAIDLWKGRPFASTKDPRVEWAINHPTEAVRALQYATGQSADAFRMKMVEVVPGAVLESLGGRSDALAVDLRKKLWKQGDVYEKTRSVTGCADPDSLKLREALLETWPSMGVISLRGVPAEIADPWLDRFAPHAPKAVLRALSRRQDRSAYRLRNELQCTGKEVIDSLRGLDDDQAWEFRERYVEQWPSTVAWSMAGVDENSRKSKMVQRCMALADGDLYVLRRLWALKDYDSFPSWMKSDDEALEDG